MYDSELSEDERQEMELQGVLVVTPEEIAEAKAEAWRKHLRNRRGEKLSHARADSESRLGKTHANKRRLLHRIDQKD